MSTVEVTAREKERAVSKRGFALGVLGAAVYLLGTFLPGISGNYEGGSSSAVALAFGPGVPGAQVRYRVGAFVLLFGTMLIVAAISLAGLRRVRSARWDAALVGASAIWFVPTLSRVLR